MKIVNMFGKSNEGIKCFTFIMMILLVGIAFTVNAAKEDCTNIDGDGAKPIQKVDEEVAGTQNDYDEVVEEDDRKGVVYLAVIGGSQPQPNACGLIPN